MGRNFVWVTGLLGYTVKWFNSLWYICGNVAQGQVYIVAQIWNDSVVPLFSLLHKRNPSLSDVEERLNITLLLSTRYKVVTMRHITWKLCGVITWCGAVFAAWSIMWWQFCGESWIVQYVTCTNVEKNFEKLCSMENHNFSQWVFFLIWCFTHSDSLFSFLVVVSIMPFEMSVCS